MRFQRASNGQIVTLSEDALLGAGGEARIYAWPGEPDLAAKIWHKPSRERSRKLQVMVANPPSDPMTDKSHKAIAWPTELLLASGPSEVLAGFLMPRVKGMRPIADFCNPGVRRKECPLFSYFYLHRTARNLAIAIRALHERGYVVGDLNESNVLVSETALVTLVDTDSFQVWDEKAGEMYRCRVGKSEFTPPELQGKKFARFDREPAHDLFGLGVMIFQLLMEGTHPYSGVYRGAGEPPPLEKRIAAGHFPYGGDPKIPYTPKPMAPPFDLLTGELRNLLVRCFRDGHFRASLRPDPQSWQWILEQAESHLVSCWWNNQHAYGDHFQNCPWCARTNLLGGRDPYPSVDEVKTGEHLRAPKRPRRLGGRRPAGAVSGSGNPPTPPPIPSSGGSSGSGARRGGRRRLLLGDWNDWSWVATVLITLGGVSAFAFQWTPNPLTFLFAIFGLLAGILGEAKAHSTELDGRGKWLSRFCMATGLAGLIWSVNPSLP